MYIYFRFQLGNYWHVEIDAIFSYIALDSVSVSSSTTLGAAGVAGARFLEAPCFLLPAERRFGVFERLPARRDDLMREADFRLDRRFGVFDRREERFLLELLEDRAERDFDRLGAFGVLDLRALLFEDFLDDFFEDFFDDFGVLARLLRTLRFEERLRERETLRVDALDFERRLGDFGVLARRVLFFEDFLEADLEVDAEETRLEPFGVFDRREERFLLELLEDRAERDFDRLGAFGVLDLRALLLEDFFDDFFEDFFDDFGVLARLLLEVTFEERLREREELRLDALGFERRLGDFGVLARRVLFFDDFLDADLAVDAEEARLEPLGARARRVARRAPLREVLLRRLPFGALGVLALRAERLEDFREDFREDLLAELLLRFFDGFGALGDLALRRLLDEERLAFLIFCSSLL